MLKRVLNLEVGDKLQGRVIGPLKKVTTDSQIHDTDDPNVVLIIYMYSLHDPQVYFDDKGSTFFHNIDPHESYFKYLDEVVFKKANDKREELEKLIQEMQDEIDQLENEAKWDFLRELEG
jgi:hypothetical protein